MGFLVPETLHAEQGKKEQQKGAREVTFQSKDKTIINDYFRTNTNNLPPGLAKRGGNLPPGLQKQLRRNGQLPQGLQKEFNPFPSELESRLPALPPTYQRGIIGDTAIIYDTKTRIILDVIQIITGLRR